MFNSTHTLLGLALARTGLDRWCPHAAWTAVIASNLPDIDIATLLYDTPAYIDYHRGVTHAIAGIPILSFALAAAMSRFSGNLRRTFIVALLAMSTHPMLDYLNTYGVRPFLPFDGTWFYGDMLFVIDPFVDLTLITALVAGQFLLKRRRTLAIAGLILFTLYVGARVELRNLSRSHLAAFPNAGVSPRAGNPFRWTGLIDERSELRLVLVNPLRGTGRELASLAKAPRTEIVERAARTRSGLAFFGFARFPVTHVEELESGFKVTFLDARYYDSDDQTGFAATIHFSGDMKVVAESLGFNQPVY